MTQPNPGHVSIVLDKLDCQKIHLSSIRVKGRLVIFVCSVIGIICQIYSFPSLTPSCKYVRDSFTDAPVAITMAKIMKTHERQCTLNASAEKELIPICKRKHLRSNKRRLSPNGASSPLRQTHAGNDPGDSGRPSSGCDIAS